MKKFCVIYFASGVPEVINQEWCDTIEEARAYLTNLEYGFRFASNGEQAFIFELKQTAIITEDLDQKDLAVANTELSKVQASEWYDSKPTIEFVKFAS